MVKQNVRVGVVGTGHWGINLARNFAELGALESIFDTNAARAQQVAGPHNARCAGSLDELLHDRAVDAVVIATPAETHHAVAKAALKAGKDVFVEKPITLHVSECQELVELADREQRILMVGHLLKYHPAIIKLREMVDEGKLGKIEYIYSNRLNLGKVRREENALWSFAPHDISIVLHLLGNQMPIQAAATGGTYLQPNIADVTVSNLLFDHGVRAHIFVSWLHPFKEQKLVVIGSKGMASFDDVAKEDKLLFYNKDIHQNTGGDFVVERAVSTPVQYEKTEPLKEECRHFLNCVATRTTPRSDGRDGYRVLAVLQACQRSLQLNGEPIHITANSMDPVLSA